MMHYREFVASRTAADTSPDLSRHLRLSQTLGIAALCALAVLAACLATGASLLVGIVSAIATLNIVPLLLGVALSAR